MVWILGQPFRLIRILGRAVFRNSPFPLNRCLGGRKTCDRHPVGGTAYVVKARLVAELNRGRVAAVLATDADLEFRPRFAALGHTHLNELAHALLVQGLEGILLDDIVLGIVINEFCRVVAGEPVGGLGQVIRAEGEELRLFRDLVGD